MPKHPPDLEALYEEYFPKVYNYIFYRLMHREETEDLVSTIFLKIARNLDAYDAAKGAAGTWIFTIAENTLKDYYRTKKYELSLDEDASVPYEPSVDFEEQYKKLSAPDHRILYQALQTLSPQERTIIFYKYYLEMQNREIAAMLAQNESTIASILLRARRKMRKILEKYRSDL